MKTRYQFKDDDSGSWCGCGCGILILLFNIFLGAWSITYLVNTLLHQHIAWGWAALIGLFGGELSIPAAIVVWLLRLAGVHI